MDNEKHLDSNACKHVAVTSPEVEKLDLKIPDSVVRHRRGRAYHFTVHEKRTLSLSDRSAIGRSLFANRYRSSSDDQGQVSLTTVRGVVATHFSEQS